MGVIKNNASLLDKIKLFKPNSPASISVSFAKLNCLVNNKIHDNLLTNSNADGILAIWYYKTHIVPGTVLVVDR